MGAFMRSSAAFQQHLAGLPPHMRQRWAATVRTGWICFVLAVAVVSGIFAGLLIAVHALLPPTAAWAVWTGILAAYIWYGIVRPEITYAALDKMIQAPRFPIIGHMYMMRRDRTAGLQELIDELSAHNLKMVPSWASMVPTVLLSHPDAVRAVLTADYTVVPKNLLTQVFFAPWLGEGLLTGGGSKWKRSRRLLTPAFHFHALQRYEGIYQKHADALVDAIAKHFPADATADACSAPFDIVPLLTFATLDIIAESACGLVVDAQRSASSTYAVAIKDACESVMDHLSTLPFVPPVLWHSLFPSGKTFMSAVRACNETCRDIIRRRQQERADPARTKTYDDFLEIVLNARDDDGSPLSDQDILDNVNTFVFAGHYEIALHPSAQVRIAEEVHATLATRTAFEYDDLKQLKYTEMVLKEVMRLHPPVPFYGRYTQVPIHVGDLTIPAHTDVFICPNLLHRLPEFWDHPDVFDPERFLPERSTGRNPYCYVPFSAGARNCLGQNFAMNEAKVLLATLVRHYAFEAVDPMQARPEPSIVLRLAPGLRVLARRRAPITTASAQADVMLPSTSSGPPAAVAAAAAVLTSGADAGARSEPAASSASTLALVGAFARSEPAASSASTLALVGDGSRSESGASRAATSAMPGPAPASSSSAPATPVPIATAATAAAAAVPSPDEADPATPAGTRTPASASASLPRSTMASAMNPTTPNVSSIAPPARSETSPGPALVLSSAPSTPAPTAPTLGAAASAAAASSPTTPSLLASSAPPLSTSVDEEQSAVPAVGILDALTVGAGMTALYALGVGTRAFLQGGLRRR